MEEIKFQWTVASAKFQRNDDRWDEQLAQLKVYKKEHGHCNVPCKYAKNPKLGQWVGWQRTLSKNGKLLDERKQLLKEIGFLWKGDNVGNCQDELWKKRLEQLNAAAHSVRSTV